MIYTFVGKVVVKAAKVFLKRKYGPTMTPKPVIAGVVVAAIVGVAVFSAKRDSA
ncbi:MAG: hypothetical protein WKF94_16020 [Solirubrobacteraceae bacterium]